MPLKKDSAEHVVTLSFPTPELQEGFRKGAKGAGDNFAVDVEFQEDKSTYELEREANIRRNVKILTDIGLTGTAKAKEAKAWTPTTVRKRRRTQMIEAAERVENFPSPRHSLRERLAPVLSPGMDGSGESRVVGESFGAQLAESRTSTGGKAFLGRVHRTRSLPGTETVGTADVEHESGRVVEESGSMAAPCRPPSNHEFARRVLQCIRRIPVGKVASYGQLAAMAGLPRNARQVGSMLKEGLCNGGMPWWRVINSAGKISLPRDGGGVLQRSKLEAEGVHFKDSGAVDDGTFWAPDCNAGLSSYACPRM